MYRTISTPALFIFVVFGLHNQPFSLLIPIDPCTYFGMEAGLRVRSI